MPWAGAVKRGSRCRAEPDRKTLRRINQLLADTLHEDPFEGIGKPEPLKHALAGVWSRRIDEANRLVYIADDTHVTVLQARYHY
ncbi:Txe/YoeB family addiction module toxin [Microbacterium sp. Bi128]|uniref:Txe/YoeB family addiction module toxin n=1 Tax=Microbacterium sp. Bi128 TaxID=2821115 RepID=UPI001D5B3234|nr:Txe/YoeB family addiction module toxin [Microbacterium sp. Bi128]CAH0160947.1 Toxin RelK [Microbacterium sp. Bi128]